MNCNPMMASAYAPDRESVLARPLTVDRQKAGPELSRRTSVMVILVLSLGLWAAIYMAVASLAGAALR